MLLLKVLYLSVFPMCPELAFFFSKYLKGGCFFKVKIIYATNSSLNSVETKSYEERRCTAVSVLILANFKFLALSIIDSSI